MYTAGILDDKLHQAESRWIGRESGWHSDSHTCQVFADDNELRDILGTTGVPYFDPLYTALRQSGIERAIIPARDFPLFVPEGIVIRGYYQVSDPWVLVTQSADDVLHDLAGSYTAGSMSRTALGWWKAEHSTHKTVRVQTDVHTRLLECSVGDWDAGLFRKSELDLLQFEQHYDFVLDSAPSEPFQGLYLLLTAAGAGFSVPSDAVAEARYLFEKSVLLHLGAKPSAAVGFVWNGDMLSKVAVYPPQGAPIVWQSTGKMVPANEIAATLLNQGAGEWVSGPHAED